MPWPNRIRDGRYSFGGRDLQLALTEPRARNASHGLVRWAAWTLEEHAGHSVSLTYRLMAQTATPGPWTCTCSTTCRRRADRHPHRDEPSAEPAPYAAGMHPYLTVGEPTAAGWTTSSCCCRPPPGARATTSSCSRSATSRWRARRTTSGSPAAARHGARPRLHRPRPRRARPRGDRAPDPPTASASALWVDAGTAGSRFQRRRPRDDRRGARWRWSR